MVDKTKLTPQQFSKRSGGIAVPGSGDIPSLRNLPTVTDTGTEAQARAFMSLADDGKRLEALSGSEFDRHMEEVKSAQRIEAEKEYANSLNVLQDGIQNIRETTEDLSEIPDKTLDFYDEATSKAVAETEGLSPYQREVLTERFNQNRLNVTNQSLGYQAQLRAMETESAVSEIVKSTSSYLFNNPGQLDVRLAELSDAIVESGVNPTEAESIIQKQTASLAQSAVQGSIDKNPSQTLASLNAGKYDQYLDGPTKNSLIRSAKASIETKKAEMSYGQRKQMVMLADDISKNPGSYTPQKIEELSNDAGLGKAQRRSLENTLIKAEVERENVLKADAKLNEIFESENGQINPYDPESKKMLDSHAKRNLVPDVKIAMENNDPYQAAQAIMAYTDTANYVPEPVMNMLQGSMLGGGSPEIRAFAVDTLMRIEESGVSLDLGQEATQFLDIAGSNIKYSSNVEEAISKTEETIRINRQTGGLLEKEAKAKSRKIDFYKLAVEASDKDKWLTLERDVASPAERAIIANRMKEVFEQNYILTGSEDNAKKRATESATKVGGITSITGKKRYNLFNPDNLLIPNPYDDDHYNKQLVSDIMAETGFTKEDLDKGEIVLIPDEQTERQYNYALAVKQGDAKPPKKGPIPLPSWKVGYINEEGYPAVIEGKKGPMFWSPKPITGEEILELDRKAAKEEFDKPGIFDVQSPFDVIKMGSGEDN